MLFERTELSRKPDELLTSELATLRGQGVLSPNLVLKDPYVLDFLELRDRYLEKDLEDAILRELENFLLELEASFRLCRPPKTAANLQQCVTFRRRLHQLSRVHCTNSGEEGKQEIAAKLDDAGSQRPLSAQAV